MPRRRAPRGVALWWSAGFAVLALLVAGGVLAASSSASQPPAAPASQAAMLNALSKAASASASISGGIVTGSATPAAPCRSRAARLKAAGHPVPAKVALWRCGRRFRRVRALGGIHGQFTFETKTGTRTLAYERGVIKSLNGVVVVVQAKDGTTWTWVLDGSTVIRENGKRVTASALSDGESVFAGGPVVSGTYDARLIVIRASSGTPSAGKAPRS
jgi:hypothetical protein